MLEIVQQISIGKKNMWEINLLKLKHEHAIKFLTRSTSDFVLKLLLLFVEPLACLLQCC